LNFSPLKLRRDLAERTPNQKKEESMLRRFVVLVCLLSVPMIVSADNLRLGSGSQDSGRFTFERRNDSGGLVLKGSLTIARTNHNAVKLQSGSIFLAGRGTALGRFETKAETS
jgi:hypothetical protein